MRSIFLVLFFVIQLISCKSIPKLNNLNKDINECVKGRTELVREDFSLKEEFDLYQFYETIEEILIQRRFLESKSKEAYKILFKEIESLSWEKKNETKYKDLLKTMDTIKNNHLTGWISTFKTPFECNRFFIKKHNLNENDYFSEYYLYLLKIVKTNETKNWRLNNKLLEETPNREFSNIIYRTPIISLFYESLKYHFLFKDKLFAPRGLN